MDDAAAAVPPDLTVLTGTEREVLEGFLELCRGAVARKLAGVAELDARRSLVPSRTTLLGLEALGGSGTGVVRDGPGRSVPGPARRSGRRRLGSGSARHGRGRAGGLPASLCGVAGGRRAVRPGGDGGAPAARIGVRAVDLRSHDRGDRATRRPRGHPARADRRQHRRRLSTSEPPRSPPPGALPHAPRRPPPDDSAALRGTLNSRRGAGG